MQAQFKRVEQKTKELMHKKWPGKPRERAMEGTIRPDLQNPQILSRFEAMFQSSDSGHLGVLGVLWVTGF